MDKTPLPVAILGAGVIGTSVAFACAAAGYSVVLFDRKDKNWTSVRSSLRRHQRLARLSSSGARFDLEEIVLSDELSDIEGAGLIVENVSEVWDVKCRLYRTLDNLDLGHLAIAANTSAFPIARLADTLTDPGRIIGVHFMNPAAQIDTVEVVRGPATSKATVETVLNFLAAMGKTAVMVNDSPGFVINRILMVMVNQAAQLVAEGVAEPAQIDQLFKGCLGHSMGPLRTADLIGIDTVVNTLRVLQASYGEPMYEPAAPLIGMVDRGTLGMKSGQGFYRYESTASNG